MQGVHSLTCPDSTRIEEAGIPVHLVNLGIEGIRLYLASCRTPSSAGHSTTVWIWPTFCEPQSSRLLTSTPWILALTDDDNMTKVRYFSEKGGRFLCIARELFQVRKLYKGNGREWVTRFGEKVVESR